MALFPPAAVAESDASLFSPEEMGRLMRGEMYRAKRYGHPMVLLLIAVDRLGNLHDLYGFESKREILRAMVELLGSVTRSSDFLGTMVDDRILAIFPHTGRRGAGAISRRLLTGARQMQFDSDGRMVQVTLSVGAVEASLEGVDSFDDLWRAADQTLARAIAAGGDRYAVREEAYIAGEEPGAKRAQPARPEAQDLPVGEITPALPAQPAQPAQPVSQADAAHPADVAGHGAPPPPPPAWNLEPGSEEEALAHRLQALFTGGGVPDEGEFALLKQEIVSFAINAAGQSAPKSEEAEEYERRISLLQRRLDKVTKSLERTEAELRRVIQLKDVDVGVESIYRTVQGLESSAPQSELKQELMKSIFEANMELKKHMEGGSEQ